MYDQSRLAGIPGPMSDGRHADATMPAAASPPQLLVAASLLTLSVAACSVGRVNDAPDGTGNPARDAIGVRNAHAMTYDAVSGRVVLFGGADAERVRGDTWAWNGEAARWIRIGADGPPPRTFPTMAFDDARGEVVLFGGNRVLFGRDDEWDTLLGDTWALRAGSWQRRDVPGPVARAEAAMAYDRRRGRIVLFGGYARGPNGRTRLGDTWEWDGLRWRQVATDGPPPRNGGALAFDERSGTIVLSGGPPAFVTPETWEWNGAAWRSVGPPHPSARFNPAMTYHSGLNALLRFGGWTGKSRANDTWIRTENGWREIAAPGPSPRNHSGLAYDRRRTRAVLFGGHDGDRIFGDTWEFDGVTWRQMTTVPPQPRLDNNH